MKTEGLTLGDFFLRSCREDSQQIFIRHVNGDCMTYEGALQRVAGMVQRFHELGLRKGDRVLCYWEETMPAIFFTLACALTGIIPIPLSPVFSIHYLKNLMTQSGARAVFSTLDRLGQLEEGELEPICYADGFVAPGQKEMDFRGSASTLPTEAALEMLELCVSEVCPDDVFMIQTTSGSTGQPKLVIRPHRAPLRYATQVGREIAHEKGERPRFLMVAALTHALGFHMFTTALSMGAELLIPNRIDARTDLEEVRALDPTVMPMTPRVLRSFFGQYRREQPGSPSGNLFGPRAKFLLVAGGSADPEFYQTVKAQGMRVLEFYGSTEASLIALTPRDDWRQGFAGKIVSDVELKIGEDGEILVRSPGLMLGYYDNQELTRSVYTEEGFYHTGDLGEVDAEGYLRIFGRKRDVFNTPEGSNIYPERIEILIESLPWVRQAILVGDRLPYLSALITVNEDRLSEFSAPALEGDYLEEKKFTPLYQRAGADLKILNSQLERVDQVVRFSLFRGPFPSDVYTVLGGGKVRRERKNVLQAYQGRMEALYHSGATLDATFVPGVDRRLRPQTDLKAHLVWGLKAFKTSLPGEMREKVKGILRQVSRDLHVEILTGDLASDHVHLFVAYPATLSISHMVQRLKGKSSMKILQAFPQLKKFSLDRHLWGRGFFAVSSGNITDEMIQNYIADQDKRTSRTEALRKAG